jgi:hypothetical protein
MYPESGIEEGSKLETAITWAKESEADPIGAPPTLPEVDVMQPPFRTVLLCLRYCLSLVTVWSCPEKAKHSGRPTPGNDHPLLMKAIA